MHSATADAAVRLALYVDHLKERGCDLYRAPCDRDLEGIVAKWSRGMYQSDGVQTSWIKIKNRGYSQAEGRHEFFDRGSNRHRPHCSSEHPPILSLQAIPKLTAMRACIVESSDGACR